MKLWEKGITTNNLVEKFTVGHDRELDQFLAPFDVIGTIAHSKMLSSIGLLTQEEFQALNAELRNIHRLIIDKNFIIEDGVEDVHSQIELMLTRKLGDVGKKVHSGRSRNDQVLVDIKLYFRKQIKELVELTHELFRLLLSLSETHKDILIPGYTHLQIAMPSSFGLWFGAYAESLADDLLLFQAAFGIANQNPLGSAAGYGSSFPLNRQMTTDLLGFAQMNYNVVYAQMGRGKTEQSLSFALAGLSSTLSKMAMDLCLYNSQNFGFVSFPDEFTTGSSIMPHKKNPDVWELVRGKTNRIKALPNDVTMLICNLPSGYHRDLQLLKEMIFPAIEEMKNCLTLSHLMLEHIHVNPECVSESKYQYLFSVEEVNKLVMNGVPFRDAYKTIARKIETGEFKPDYSIHHTHEGSIGNLCNDQISQKFENLLQAFDFKTMEEALNKLLNEEE